MNEIVDEKWQLDLEKKKQLLEECQKSKNLKSCFACEKLLDCIIRDEYIQAVYDSMSRGETGGFEF
jgi:hypothetical protein